MARNFENWLSAYMHYTRDSESPNQFHFWTGVWTIAGALRRKVWIDMRKWQWTANFYVVIVGPPGVAAKSTSMRNGTRLLEQVDGVKFGPQSLTWQKLTKSLEDSMEYIPTENPRASAEELIKGIPMSALNISIGELGTFLKMEDSSLDAVLISMWDGQLESWGHGTVSQGTTTIKNPWLNIIGCTTPSWLRNNFPQHMIDGGLTSRCVFVYGDRKRHLIAYPDEVIPDGEYHEYEGRLLDDLRQIAAMSGPMIITEEARNWGREWYESLWADRPVEMASDRYTGYLSRKQTHMHKLAMILSAARSNSMVIDKAHLEEALVLLGDIEGDMIKVFESIGVVDEAKHVAELIALVRAHGFLTSEQLWAQVQNVMSQRDFIAALSAAVQGGRFMKTSRDGNKGVSLGPMH